MFVILLDPSKNELRAVRRDCVIGVHGHLMVPHRAGGEHTRRFEYPPGFELLEDLTVFASADEAFASIQADFCPSLHP